MNDNRIGDPPDPRTASTPAELTERLEALRLWAGRPSLRRLRRLGGARSTANGAEETDALPETTTSYVLRGDRPASAEFVRSFVAACMRARRRDEAEIAHQIERWHDAWLAVSAEAAPVAPVADRRAARYVPQQLPADVSGFTGRAEGLAALDELLLKGETANRVPVVIAAIAGTAGVGKTALAVHWAHRVRDRFPDGQLYLNLRGYAAGQPLGPIEALSMQLRSLGVPPEQVPVAEAEASARYRSLLADRRVLVVLDNARSVEQVRPLLPGTAGCLALVTSRDRLAGLVARDGAQRLTLDVLTAGEAYALLTGLLDPGRVQAEPEAIAELAKVCGYLPLALRIAAANLLDRPHQSVGAVVAGLAAGHRLAALEVSGDEQTAVRATFDLSYRAVPQPAQRLCRLLGLAPGPDFTGDAAAALADLPPEQTQRLLGQLASAHLVNEHALGRYTFHDLVRDYARYRAERDERGEEPVAAVQRLLGWYLHTADAASRVLYPTVARLPAAQPPAEQTPTPVGSDRTGAMAWLDAERTNLVAVAEHAANHGPRHVAWRLTDALRLYLWSGRHHTDGLLIARAGLSAAVADGHPAGQVAAQLCLSQIYQSQADYPSAHGHSVRAVALAESAGWREGEAAANNFAGNVCQLLGRLDDAVDYLSRALAINRDLGRAGAQGVNLASMGVLHFARGELATSLRSHQEALEISRDVKDRLLEATELANLGEGHHAVGDLDTAIGHLEQALTMAVEIGDPQLESMVLCNTASVHYEAGLYNSALECANRSLAVAQRTGDVQQEAYALSVIAKVHNRLGDHEHAIARHREALDLVPDDSPLNKTEMLVELADAYLRLGQYAQAIENAEEALALSRAMTYRMREGQVLTVLAEIRLSQGQLTDAQDHAEQALITHYETGYRIGQARTLAVLGHTRHANGDVETARQHWHSARLLVNDIGIVASTLRPGE